MRPIRRRSRNATLLFLLLHAVTASRPATSAEIDGHEFANHVRVGDRDLILYSAAVRKATFLKVHVYTIGLYVPPGSIDRDPIHSDAIESERPGAGAADRNELDDLAETKALVMTLLRDVKSEKLAHCLLGDFRRACGDCAEPLLSDAERLAQRLPDLSEGDRITYVIENGTVDVLINEESIGLLEGEPATLAVLDAFLGETAPKDVREALRTSRWDLAAATERRD